MSRQIRTLLTFCSGLLFFSECRAGAGGCALAQTLVEGGKYVLLLERGDERSATTTNILNAGEALFDVCTESFVSTDGVVVATGNCMGGAT